MNEFYVNLPSNVIPLDGSSNFVNIYTTEFVDPIILNGEWYVGLSDISFLNQTRTISSTQDGNFEVHILDKTADLLFEDKSELKLVVAEDELSHSVKSGIDDCVFWTENPRYLDILFKIMAKLRSVNPTIIDKKYEKSNINVLDVTRPDIRTKNVALFNKNDPTTHLNKVEVFRVVYFKKNRLKYFKNLLYKKYKYNIPIGNYENIIPLVNSFNSLVKQDIKMEYIKYSNKIEINSELDFKIKFSPVLSLIFGYPNNEIDLNQSIHHVYIYIDIIEPIRVGSGFSRVLKIIPVNLNKNVGEMLSFNFQHPLLVPLERKSIQKINVEFRTDTGSLLPIYSGKSLLTIKFVKVDL